MPYIKIENRNEYINDIKNLKNKIILKEKKAGEINYIITKLLLEVYNGIENYSTYNEIIGILECCKLEFYRRKVSNYENQKINLNTDVY